MAASKHCYSERPDLNEDFRETWFTSKSPEEQIKNLRIMFESVEDMLESPDYDDELRDELTNAYPNYMIVFKTAKRDLLRNDCGIVVAGEACAGKTTLINQLVGNNVFPTGNCATTGRITRIHDSEKMEIKCYSQIDILIKEKEVNGVKQMRSVVSRLTDIHKIKEDSNDIYYVDVHLPVPMLKGNVILVDTPGLGENVNLDKILMDFLPHAVSFVFVVNVRNAGGVHEDRLSKILKTIMDNREKMPCFDPREIIFLTSQWDAVNNKDASSDDEYVSSDDENVSSDEDNIGKRVKENQHTQTWNTVIKKLENAWDWFDIENVFRVSLEQVEKGLETSFTEEYTRFKTVLKTNIEKNKNKRVEFYYRFLKNFIRHAERGALTRLNMFKRTEEEQRRIINQNNAMIHDLQLQCKQKRKELVIYKTEIVSMLAKKLYDFLSSDIGRMKILNPPGMKSICIVSYFLIGKEVSTRFQNGMKLWCKSHEVKTIINEANAKIRSFAEVLESKLHDIDINMTDAGASAPFNPFDGTLVVGLLHLPFALVFMLVASVLLLPYTCLVSADAVMCSNKANAIYDVCLKQISISLIEKGFEESFGVEYDKAIVRVFDQSLPNVIKSLFIMNERLLDSHQISSQKQESLLRLKDKILKIQKATEDFKRDY